MRPYTSKKRVKTTQSASWPSSQTGSLGVCALGTWPMIQESASPRRADGPRVTRRRWRLLVGLRDDAAAAKGALSDFHQAPRADQPIEPQRRFQAGGRMSVTVDDQLLEAEQMGLRTVGQVLSHVQRDNRLVVNLL